MGVDAQMLVKTRRALSENAVHALALDLAEAFGPEKFYLNREADDYGDGSHYPAHHALSIVDKFEQDGDTIFPSPGEQFIEVHTWHRYYGVGYERGDLPTYIGIAEWLERRIPGCAVFYGGDSSGICAEPFDAASRAALMDHFAKVGHKPYRGGWDRERDGPLCDFCRIQMQRCGWGPEWAAWSCAGCGDKWERRGEGPAYKVCGSDWCHAGMVNDDKAPKVPCGRCAALREPRP